MARRRKLSAFQLSCKDWTDRIHLAGGLLDEDLWEAIKTEAEELLTEEEEKLSNLEEYHLENGPAGTVIQERISQLEEFISVLEDQADGDITDEEAGAAALEAMPA